MLMNIRKFNARRRLKKAGTAIIGSIRWRRLTQANKQTVPQSTKQISGQGAQGADMTESSPQTNNFMLNVASSDGGESVTPGHDTTHNIVASHGFGESTHEMSMRSEESKDYAQ